MCDENTILAIAKTLIKLGIRWKNYTKKKTLVRKRKTICLFRMSKYLRTIKINNKMDWPAEKYMQKLFFAIINIETRCRILRTFFALFHLVKLSTLNKHDKERRLSWLVEENWFINGKLLVNIELNSMGLMTIKSFEIANQIR